MILIPQCDFQIDISVESMNKFDQYDDFEIPHP